MLSAASDRMRSVDLLCLLAVATCGIACSAPSTDEAAESGADERVLVGSFVTPTLPHPVLVPEQHYFRPSPASPDTEWIAIVPERLVERVRLDEPVRIRGRAVAVDLGGDPGTRASYRGTKLLISEIQDVDGPE